jgi:hypothetical protein
MRALAAWWTGLRAALLLARGREEGVRLLDVGPADAMRLATCSFIAAPICLPTYTGKSVLDCLQAGVSGPALRGVAAGLLALIVGWAGFALASHRLAAVLHRSSLWPRFIALWNWCNVLQNLVMLAALVPVALGLPAWVDETVWLVALGWALWLEWFATRASLAISGWPAAGLVALDLAIGLVGQGFADAAG